MSRATRILPPGPLPAKMTKRKGGTPEGVIVKECLELLALWNIPAWRNNTGAMHATYKGKDRFIRYGAVGSPDIFGIMSGGRLLGVECKVLGGKVSDAQMAFGLMMRNAGAKWVVVRSAVDLEQELWSMRGVPPC